MWNWRSCPIVAGCSSELECLVNDMDLIRLQPRVDQLSCLLSVDGKYRVDLLRKKIDQGFTANVHHFQISWCKLIPIKVTTFIWRVVMGKILSVVALSYRGVTLDTCNCSSCVGGIEYANHILVECPYAKSVTKSILNWCGIDRIDFHNVEEITCFAANWGRCPKKRERLTAICYGMLWSIWRARNDRIFQAKFITPNGVVDNIKALVYLWVKCRGKGGLCNWEEWLSCPFSS
ncbi:unnamed protein product [Lactuca virosa]|uniref:Reverse transcriptase zinc-binding domain-containing protein n=1 Tax=Lactuca virosa TaxID=75947 RepID=A0AAU9LAE2_9ASTR|nr:unnamed protein product [Lactuca virosa]